MLIYNVKNETGLSNCSLTKVCFMFPERFPLAGLAMRLLRVHLRLFVDQKDLKEYLRVFTP